MPRPPPTGWQAAQFNCPVVRGTWTDPSPGDPPVGTSLLSCDSRGSYQTHPSLLDSTSHLTPPPPDSTSLPRMIG